MKTPVHPDEALLHVLTHARAHRSPFENVPLVKALGRVLACDVPSLLDQPPFAKTAVDGFAYRRSANAPNERFRVITVIPAGRMAPLLQPGEAVRIMTGAPIPENADGVQRVEWTRMEDDHVYFTTTESASNIIARGENAKRGDVLMSPRILTPQDIGILAASGYAYVPVARRLRVKVVSTGDELFSACIQKFHDPEAFLHVETTLGKAGIFDSNGPQLTACVQSFGADATFLGIVPDNEQRMVETITDAIQTCDVVVVSGGVSMGDFDHIPAVAARVGVTTIFHGVRMRPGMPAYFGVCGPVAFFGLPGNPVSSFVHAVFFLQPYLNARMGLHTLAPLVPVTLSKRLSRKKGENVQFWPVRLRWPEGIAEPLAYHGSSMVTVLGDTNAFIRMEEGQTEIQPNEIIHARLVRPHH